MNRLTANSLRRIAGTFLVFLALLVACAGIHATPCKAADANANALHAPLVVDALADGGGDLDDPDAEDVVSSLEDNNSGLDDTFDVPPEHVVTMPRLAPGRPPGLVPPPHAHARSSELRPPIA